MPSLSVLALVASLCISISHTQTCTDVYYPETLPHNAPDKFSLVLAGLTGTGKSTLIDILAGGHEISAVGTVNGDSETEQACAFHFTYLDGKSPAAGDERWEALDTPGYDDTGGKEHSIANDEVVEQALRKMGKVDAVLLTWKYDEKFTEANLGAFAALRANFDASIWKRVVIVYTHWHWEDCVEFLCDCKQQSDLQKVHEDTMAAAFKYIAALTGDDRCNSTVNSKCFPEFKDIPYVGSDLTLDRLKRMRDLGCDPLDNPSSADGSCTSMCPIDSAKDIRNIRSHLLKITTSPGYQPLDMSKDTNYWVACETTKSNLQRMIDGCTDATPCPEDIDKDTASHLQDCIKGGIASETQKVAELLHGRVDLQVQIAFAMTKSKYIVEPYFSADVAHDISVYPDYRTYTSCKLAEDLNVQDAKMLTDAVTDCWTSLMNEDGQPRSPQFATSVGALLSSHKGRSFELRMAIALNMDKCERLAQTVSKRCRSYLAFSKNVSSLEEQQDLSLWSKFISNGRCCMHQPDKSHMWTPRTTPDYGGLQTGQCNDTEMVWNQTNINCLRYCSLTDLSIPSCQVSSDGSVVCNLKEAVHGTVQPVKGMIRKKAPNDASKKACHWSEITIHGTGSTDCFAHDVEQFAPQHTDDIDTCKSLYLNNPSCSYVTRDADGNCACKSDCHSDYAEGFTSFRKVCTEDHSYVDIGEGKCLADGVAPFYAFYDGQSSTCEDLCNADLRCRAFSASKSEGGNCWLWYSKVGAKWSLGEKWQDVHCHIKQYEAYVASGDSVMLDFDLSKQVHFVMTSPAEQKAVCHEGEWKIRDTWVLPSGRQVRDCTVCTSSSTCLGNSCSPGVDGNKLWLTGAAEDSRICTDEICGPQKDAECHTPPTCSHLPGQLADLGGLYRTKDCSTSSCGFDDCCEKLGTCEGVCDCPWKPKSNQPTHCRGQTCEKDECCEKDETVENCSPATGGTCSFFWCGAWRGETKCQHRGLFQWECVCSKPGQCARDYGYKTGHCEDKCTKPDDCSPDTGGYCDKTMASIGVNTCADWRGDTYCTGGRCLCSAQDNNKNCAVQYGEDTGICTSGGQSQLAATSPGQGHKAQLMMAFYAAVSAGLLAAVSCLLVVRRYVRSRDALRDPLLDGGVLEAQ